MPVRYRVLAVASGDFVAEMHMTPDGNFCGLPV